MNITYNSSLINDDTENVSIITIIWFCLMMIICGCACVYIPKWSYKSNKIISLV